MVIVELIGSLKKEHNKNYAPYPILKISVNGGSTMCGAASSVIGVATGY
jgi:hypothetical protein